MARSQRAENVRFRNLTDSVGSCFMFNCLVTKYFCTIISLIFFKKIGNFKFIF